jgi:hypothetical protein
VVSSIALSLCTVRLSHVVELIILNYASPGLMAWSADSHYLFTRNDNMPTALWIWDISRLELTALLIHKEPIRAAAWDPVYPRIAICTGTPHLYMWTPNGAACVSIP